MKASRATLLIVSTVVVLVLLGGGLAFRAGAADSSFHQASRFYEVFELVQQNYVDPVNADSLLDGAYEGMLNGLDVNGSYMTAGEVAEWNARDAEAVADPGIEALKSYGALQVVRVVPGSPADAAGIQQGDQIRSLNGRSLRNVSLDQALRMLRGRPGTTVTLGVLHTKDGIHREELKVKRAVRSEAAQPGPRDTLVLTVHDLGRSGSSDLAKTLREARAKERRGSRSTCATSSQALREALPSSACS
jgi:C-terminal processing protease CtpA/Prc